MPVGHPPASPLKHRSLAELAGSRMLIEVSCGGCHRRVNFWAEDLLRVLGPDHRLARPPFPCSKCRSSESLDMRFRCPAPSDLAKGLTVRRPVKQVVRWIWRDERA